MKIFTVNVKKFYNLKCNKCKRRLGDEKAVAIVINDGRIAITSYICMDCATQNPNLSPNLSLFSHSCGVEKTNAYASPTPLCTTAGNGVGLKSCPKEVRKENG